jgi:tetratricopeptide (TPR) repeat protein
MRTTTRAFTTTITAVVLSFGLTLSTGSAVAQQTKNQVSQKVGTPLQAALTAAKSKQFDAAITKLKEAEGVSGKTPFEQFKILEVYSFIYSSQGKWADLAGIQEKQLQMPQFLPPGKAEQLPRDIAKSYASASQSSKFLEFANQWLKTHPNDTEMLVMVGQTHYQTKDYKQCREIMNGVISQTEKAGSEPKEGWLEISQRCSFELGDNAAVTSSLQKLVRYHPKPEWWQRYIKAVARDEKSDMALFQWNRLSFDVGVFKDASPYIEYTQSAMIEFGSPLEAQRVVESGFSKQVLGQDAKNKIRHETLLNKSREAAKDAKTKLAQLQAQADKATTGEYDAQIGMIQFGSEQYDQAIKSFETAIKKGGLKDTGTLKQDLGTVKMSLGIAQLKKGQRDQARSTFKSMESDPVFARAASAWALRSYN